MKKYDSYSVSIFISDYYYYLSSDSDWYERQYSGCKYTNRLYHVVTNNLKNKDQCNASIDYEPKCYNEFSLPSDPTIYTLPLVTVILRGGMKNRATIIYGLK